MSVSRAKQRQAEGKINQARQVAQVFAKPLGGWVATFQEAIGMSAPALAERLGVSRNSVYSSIQNEQAGTISLNQLDKMAEAMGGKLVYRRSTKASTEAGARDWINRETELQIRRHVVGDEPSKTFSDAIMI